MNLWITIVIAGLLTFAIRLSFIVLLHNVAMPLWFQRALNFVPPAVLSAIILPALLAPGDKLDISLGNARLIAGVLAALVAWRTKNVLLTIVVGMAGLVLLQALGVSG